jgi:hypothetical protein
MEEMDQFAMKEAEKDGTTTSQRTGRGQLPILLGLSYTQRARSHQGIIP